MLNNILIVDDSVQLHQIYKITLKRYKCGIITALGAEEGLNQLTQLPDVELMIVDMNMPHVSGLEFIKRVREQDAYNNTPIIVVTTRGKDEGVREAVELAEGNLVKPFTSTELHEQIEDLFPQYVPIPDDSLVNA